MVAFPMPTLRLLLLTALTTGCAHTTRTTHALTIAAIEPTMPDAYMWVDARPLGESFAACPEARRAYRDAETWKDASFALGPGEDVVELTVCTWSDDGPPTRQTRSMPAMPGRILAVAAPDAASLTCRFDRRP